MDGGYHQAGGRDKGEGDEGEDHCMAELIYTRGMHVGRCDNSSGSVRAATQKKN